jgi:hypothetical protein
VHQSPLILCVVSKCNMHRRLISYLVYLIATVFVLTVAFGARVQSRPAGGNELTLGSAVSQSQNNPTRTNRINDPTIPSPFTQSPRSLPAIKVDPQGKVYTTQILKQQLANELGLPLRDLRIVDPSFPSQIQATFMARPNVILFCIENIKVVVQRNEALVFSPYQAEVQEFVPALQQQIALAINGKTARSNGDGPSFLVNSARFEHIVIEAALNVACSTLLRRFRALIPAVATTLNGLRAESRGLDVVQTQVDELLPLKNKLDVLQKRVKEIKRAITEILNSDEDMEMMQLGSPFLVDYDDDDNRVEEIDLSDGSLNGWEFQPRPHSVSNDYSATGHTDKIDTDGSISGYTDTGSSSHSTASAASNIDTTADTDETMSDHLDKKKKDKKKKYLATMNLEMLFENYLNEIEWISAEVEEEIDEITNTEENVVLQLDLLRNRILRFELMLSISSFVIACGALITGLFGMNLLSYIEFHKSAFYVVTGLMVAGMASAFFAFKKYAKVQKLF